MMSDDFTPKSHNENFVKLQGQDSFHVKKLKFHLRPGQGSTKHGFPKGGGESDF